MVQQKHTYLTEKPQADREQLSTPRKFSACFIQIYSVHNIVGFTQMSLVSQVSNTMQY